MARKNETARERRIRRGVVGKFKTSSTNSKKGGGSSSKKGTTNSKKEASSSPKKGTKRSGRFEGMTTGEIRDFREGKGKGKFATPAESVVEPVTIDTTETQIPEQAEPAFDYQAELRNLQIDYQDQLRQQQQTMEAERQQRELYERTMMANQARSGQSAEYQLGSPTKRTRGGTFGFGRRRRKLMPAMRSMLGGISGATGGSLNT